MSNENWNYYNLINMNNTLDKLMLAGNLPYEYFYVKDVLSLKMSMFKYENIDKIKNLTNEILELALLCSGDLCFANVPGLGIMLCKYIVNGELNEYCKPTHVDLLTLKGDTVAMGYPYDKVILVKDNAIGIIPYVCINEYLVKVQRIDDTTFKVLNNCSLPLAVVGNKKAVNQLKSIAGKLGVKDPFIIGDDTIIDTVKSFDIKVPVSPLDLFTLKNKYRNELLSSLGIYSLEQKRERLVVSEISSQNDYTDFIYQDCKTQRQAFVDALNKLDPSLNIKLIEVYDINKEEVADEKADLTYKVEKAKIDANPEELPNKDKEV